jgi:hypothetical protein
MVSSSILLPEIERDAVWELADRRGLVPHSDPKTPTT